MGVVQLQQQQGSPRVEHRGKGEARGRQQQRQALEVPAEEEVGAERRREDEGYGDDEEQRHLTGLPFPAVQQSARRDRGMLAERRNAGFLQQQLGQFVPAHHAQRPKKQRQDGSVEQHRAAADLQHDGAVVGDVAGEDPAVEPGRHPERVGAEHRGNSPRHRPRQGESLAPDRVQAHRIGTLQRFARRELLPAQVQVSAQRRREAQYGEDPEREQAEDDESRRRQPLPRPECPAGERLHAARWPPCRRGYCIAILTLQPAGRPT